MSRQQGNAGAISIWLTLIVLALAMSFVLIYSVLFAQYEHNEMVRRLELSSKWTLSHYDDALFSHYGILGYNENWMTQTDVYSDNLKGSVIKVEKTHSLGEGESFLQQTIMAYQAAIATKGLQQASSNVIGTDNSSHHWSETLDKEMKAIESTAAPLDQSSSPEKKEEAKAIKEQIDNAEKAGKSLPGSGSSQTNLIMPELHYRRFSERSIGRMSQLSAIELQLFHEYLLSRFQSKTVDPHVWISPTVQETYFGHSEMAFLLHGKRHAEINEQLTSSEIVAIRVGVNAVHLLSCKTHLEQMHMMSATVASVFPLGEPFVFGSIVVAWSTMESLEELKQLERGHPVSCIKQDDGLWKTQFMGGSSNREALTPPLYNRVYYSDYLRLMLSFRSTEQKIKRAMTLIEMNMSDLNGETYRLETMVTSHRITTKWRRFEYSFEDGYLFDRDGVYDKEHAHE